MRTALVVVALALALTASAALLVRAAGTRCVPEASRRRLLSVDDLYPLGGTPTLAHLRVAGGPLLGSDGVAVRPGRAAEIVGDVAPVGPAETPVYVFATVGTTRVPGTLDGRAFRVPIPGALLGPGRHRVAIAAVRQDLAGYVEAWRGELDAR